MLARLFSVFCRALDRANYLFMLTRLAILDRLLGPEPETPEDEISERQREKLRKAFPGLLPEDRDRR